MAWFPYLFIFALGLTRCSGAIIENVADLNKSNLKFDFIVVGGGTAGNVIANRLSENPQHSVVVWKQADRNASAVIAPHRITHFGDRNANILNIILNRVDLCSEVAALSVNYMAYTRGSKEDFDRFAKFTGDHGWSWDNLIPYMRKNERFSPPSDHHNTAGQFNPAVHGFDGINAVSLEGFPSPVAPRIIETTTQLEEFPFSLDINLGLVSSTFNNPSASGWEQATIRNGSRSNSATSYLAPQFIRRPNLHVLLHARVTRILQTAPGAFRTVEFVQDLNDEWLTLTAGKELVLSAGSIGTPHILLHSGIGDSSTLTSLGIKPVPNLPSVGQNLSDHTLLLLSFLVRSNDTYETAERNATLAVEHLARWNTTRTGPLVENASSHLGWLRIPDNSSIRFHLRPVCRSCSRAQYSTL
ncbi:hypothetical protein DFH09DRAFT_1424395 [Mycena vulgaris]|nr:hypothetical protein DFH09DRAFT_1424395 [Mycena vulgaris]